MAQLSVSSGKDGLIQRATFLAFGDSQDHTSAWPLADVVVSLNRWLQRVSGWIWQASGTWEYDDTNQTDLPIATTTLVANQEDYALPTTTLKILRVEVKDSSGNFSKLQPFDQSELYNRSYSEFEETAGLPIYYDIIGNSIILKPAPATGSVTLAAGLKIHLSREATTFSTPASYTTADTTQPGIDEPFHDMLCICAAYDFCLTNGPDDRTSRLRSEIEVFKQDLFKHYGDKNRDKKVALKPRRESYT